MSSAVRRFTIGFEEPAMAAIDDVIETTNYKAVPDVVRASVSVFVDLLDVEDRGMEIILRNPDGGEWRYSPHKPGRALPINTGSEKREAIVIRPDYWKRPAAKVGDDDVAASEQPDQAEDAPDKKDQRRRRAGGCP